MWISFIDLVSILTLHFNLKNHPKTVSILTLDMNKFYRSSLNSVFNHKAHRDKRCHHIHYECICNALKGTIYYEEFLLGGKGNSTLTKVECHRMTLVVKVEGAWLT